MKRNLKSATALVAAASLLQPALLVGAAAQSLPLVTAQPNPPSAVMPYFNPNPDIVSYQNIIPLLQQQVKYVFVIFNENHSFDNEYGTFPGVNGIYSDGINPRSPANTPGFTQTYQDVNGNAVTVQPFLLGPNQNSTFRDSVDHSHTGLATKINVVNGVAQMNQFSLDEYDKYAKAGNIASQKEGTEFARVVMSHIDCNTIPFFWQYASRFVIFDNIFATEDTPSAPNAIAMLAGQSGETQWVKHPSTDGIPTDTGIVAPYSGTVASYTGANVPTSTFYNGTGPTAGPPLISDQQPWWGSVFDSSGSNIRQPNAPKEFWAPSNIASNLTFATVPLTLMGSNITTTTNQDLNAAFDLPDIQQDIPFIQSLNQAPVGWRWYQNGYDAEPTDSNFALPHTNYVSHHNGAQYFGYLANNPTERSNYRGENDFFTDMANNALPPGGGVFYIRGGYYNLKYPQDTPPIQNPTYPPSGLTASDIATINLTKSGDDDHPSYSDSNLSEAMAARVINAIASNPEIWAHSAIIITYDESDGFWDHVPPRILSYGPDSLPLSRGVRIPLLLISPFARAGAVSHAEGDHNSIIQTINAIFGRPALSTLPDEAQALAQGNSAYFNAFGPPGFQQNYLGPRDTNSPITDSLLSGFDPLKLLGQVPPLPASYAMIPSNVVETLPHYGGNGCQAIGITPVDQAQGIVNYIPPGFNPLPATLPAYSHLRLVSHDFNGDSFSDIAWRNTNGDLSIWLMATQSGNAQIVSSFDFGIVPDSWQLLGQRDFNGDGNADLLWQNTNGDTSIWLMNGTQVSQVVDLGIVGNGWTIVGTGDFNGDGYADILWRNTNGDTSIWLMTGTATQVKVLSTTDLGSVPTSWSVAQTGDFNRDGKTDILWHNTNNGDTSIWLMTANGTQIQVLSVTDFGKVPTSWMIAGTGDFNADGYADILWHNANGDTSIWLMTANGTQVQVASTNDLGFIPTSWNVALTSDLNGDGKTDILWRNSNGDASFWFMNGAQVLSVSDIGIVPASWIVQASGAD
jgi:phospholipase C